MFLDDTSLGYPLPHPENPAKTVDVPRLRLALEMIDAHVAALQAERDALATDKADKTQVAIDIAAAVSQAIFDLLDGAPEAYDTLVEIAAKLTDNDDVVAGILSTLATKANAADVATALGLKADAAAMTDALAVKADKTTVADQLADKASHAEVTAQVQTVAPIGNIVHAAAAPDATYLPLDGSKYLRSAYPEIAPLFAAMPRGATVTKLTNPAGVGLCKCVVAGNFLLSHETGESGRIYRAPVSTPTGGADFVEVTSVPGNYIKTVLKASTGRVLALSHPTVGVTGQYRYSDDDGATWSALYTISARAMTEAYALLHYPDHNVMMLATGSGLLRIEGNIPAASYVAGSETVRGAVAYRDASYGFNTGGGLFRYDVATGVFVLSWRFVIFHGNAGRLAVLNDELVATYTAGTELTAVRLSGNRAGKVFARCDMIISQTYTSSASQVDVAAVEAAGSRELLAVQLRATNGSGSYEHQLALIDGDGEVLFVVLEVNGVSQPGGSITSANGVLGISSNSSGADKYRVIPDTNAATEFRLPNRPNHYIKAVA